MLYGMEHRFG